MEKPNEPGVEMNAQVDTCGELPGDWSLKILEARLWTREFLTLSPMELKPLAEVMNENAVALSEIRQIARELASLDLNIPE